MTGSVWNHWFSVPTQSVDNAMMAHYKIITDVISLEISQEAHISTLVLMQCAH